MLWLVGRLLNVPFFYFAIGSQSHIGGPASAPVVASAFHRSLAPVGNRTLLGHNIAGEFCAGRFLDTGKFKQWIEIAWRRERSCLPPQLGYERHRLAAFAGGFST